MPETSRPVSVCHAPASLLCPSVQFRKGAPLFENSIGLKGFSPCLRPFRAWALGAGESAGTYNAPGLPEIKGEAAFGQAQTEIGALGSASGALSVGGQFNVRYWSPLPNGGMYSKLFFTASQANPLYGASATVMPPSVNAPVILYLGRAAQI